ncbi:hypothetical protein B0H67DRAFT_482391 [Lasiosphaeris hirsuta]|uniref:Uncharacterized protein n=1 Tax=Lasiosphaeris hirsuta TaxID=260670 RepID=A0AA40B1F8_9PEZI|nr:hypothetical protein B0H67DRAFT_482391 [Lasiosphaeris hirsuta]
MRQLVPFASNVLAGTRENESTGIRDTTREDEDVVLFDQFPASYIIENDLQAPQGVPDLSLIEDELNPKRLHKITNLLWLAGRPVPPRPLHYQQLLGRDVVVSERIDIHLVWGQGRIFVKPIPRYLLNPRFWRDHLVCRCTPSERNSPDGALVCLCGRQRLHQCALGLLLQYAALIVHESDFTIALDKHLIPYDISWPRWRRFVRELLHGNGSESGKTLYGDVAERFIYGELRLNRLNLIEMALRGPLSRGFVAVWDSYGSFYRDNSAVIIGGTAYILLILSAMQVGLGTSRLQENDAFQAASYGFTVFSILGPLAAIVLLFIVFSIAIFYNLARTRQFEKNRSKKLGRTWRIEKQATARPGRGGPGIGHGSGVEVSSVSNRGVVV